MRKQTKYLLLVFVFSILGLNSLLADDLDDCINFERQTVLEEGFNFEEASEYAQEICTIKIELGWTNYLARYFSNCMKSESRASQKKGQSFQQAIEHAKEFCDRQVKNKKKIENIENFDREYVSFYLTKKSYRQEFHGFITFFSVFPDLLILPSSIPADLYTLVAGKNQKNLSIDFSLIFLGSNNDFIDYFDGSGVGIQVRNLIFKKLGFFLNQGPFGVFAKGETSPSTRCDFFQGYGSRQTTDFSKFSSFGITFPVFRSQRYPFEIHALFGQGKIQYQETTYVCTKGERFGDDFWKLDSRPRIDSNNAILGLSFVFNARFHLNYQTWFEGSIAESSLGVGYSF